MNAINVCAFHGPAPMQAALRPKRLVTCLCFGRAFGTPYQGQIEGAGMHMTVLQLLITIASRHYTLLRMSPQRRPRFPHAGPAAFRLEDCFIPDSIRAWKSAICKSRRLLVFRSSVVEPHSLLWEARLEDRRATRDPFHDNLGSC